MYGDILQINYLEHSLKRMMKYTKKIEDYQTLYITINCLNGVITRTQNFDLFSYIGHIKK